MGIDIGGALSGARHWVGDRLDDAESAKDWVGGKIDGAVQSAEDGIDGFRDGLVDFGRDHGGVVGEALAQQVSNSIGVTEGVLVGAYDMGAGVVQLADGASKLVNPLEWATHADRNLARLETVGQTAVALNNLGSPVAWVSNPEGNLQTAHALWDGVTEGYQEAAADGDWSKFAGRLVLDVGSLFVGAGEANAVIRGTEAAGALGRVGRAGDVAADVGRVTGRLDDLGDAGRIARGADDLVPLSRTQIEDISAIAKGQRPDPSRYLPESYIDQHLAQFEDGATRFQLQSKLDKYGPGQTDGTSFVIPKQEADRLLAETAGDPRALEEALGLPAGQLDGADPLMRVDFADPGELGLRMPSGNEAGANDLWIPGGKLPDGSSEAVIDVGGTAASRYTATPVDP
jgi:hypothetical protein